MERKSSHQLHVLTVCLMCIVILLFIVLTGGLGHDVLVDLDPFTEYGVFKTSMLYFLRLLTFLPLPQAVFNFLGLVFYNSYTTKPKVNCSALFGPFLCFRTVTKGTFPDLVKKNVERNIATCSRIGIDNYIIEVVTDIPLNLPKSPRFREILVPANYSTRNSTRYKARALQYCLEQGVDMLADSDWIVHLDEETLLTESSVVGILNFVDDGNSDLGQGVITYAHEDILNWITTLADLVRVGMDYGMIRFCLKFLNKPVFGWKGSFIVVKASVERQVTFDFGFEGSIAEDCFFALCAWRDGYQFGFVEGQMWEKSTFTIKDFVFQRQRWVNGIYNVFWSRQIPWRYKLGITLMLSSWFTMPLTVFNIVLIPLYPIPIWRSVNIMCGFMGGVMMFLFIFGALKSFSPRRMGWANAHAMLCFAPISIVPISMLLETTGIILALKSRNVNQFHIVNKQTTNSLSPETNVSILNDSMII